MTPSQLKAWREGIGLTQKQTAEAFGVPHSSYCHWEQGRIRMNPLMWLATLGYEVHAKSLRTVKTSRKAA